MPMLWRKRRTPYLVKANDDLVSWCKCKNAPIASSAQAGCPWCGCGWLFTCLHCRKAFTFARAVLMKESLEELASLEVPRTQKIISLKGDVRQETLIPTVEFWIEAMQPLIGDLELGKTYVYFDGHSIPTDARGIRMRGMRRSHDLDYIPHIRALTDPSAEELLHDFDYWTAEDK
jgi:hypothetical protein